jgi:hypothetical protein
MTTGDSERAELRVRGVSELGEHWYGWQVFVPEDWRPAERGPEGGGNDIITQWHRGGRLPKWARGHPMTLNIGDDGKYRLTWNYGGPDRVEKEAVLEQINANDDKGKWTHWAFHVKWAKEDTPGGGFMRLYHNGSLVFSHDGPNHENLKTWMMWKAGIYHGNPSALPNDPYVLLGDNYVLADAASSLAEVNPYLEAGKANGSPGTAQCTASGEESGTQLNLTLRGKQLRIEANLPSGTRQFEMRIESSRNNPITRFSAISPYDRDMERRRARYNRSPHDTWFPVVDIELEQGMEGVCIFKGDPSGAYTFGGPYYDDQAELSKTIVVPSGRLEYWENSLRVPTKDIEIERFYLRKTYPALLDEFRHTINLLSVDWNGTVSLHVETDQGMRELASGQIGCGQMAWVDRELEAYKGKGMSRERLIAALSALITDGMRRQNTNPHSPTYGSFHTFYDFDAKLHRTAYWLWGGSPIVKMVCDAIRLPEIQSRFDTEDLVHRVDKVGQLYLKYQVRAADHPSRGSFLVIWTRKPSGYRKWVGTSDSGIMHKWAILPLYHATGNPAYLEAARFWSLEKGRLLKRHEILPHYYLYDENRFNEGILDETGWDPEGHEALYLATGEDIHRQIARTYMDKHMAKFQNENGLWNRSYDIARRQAYPPSHMTRGMGWAMEGLLAMNTVFPDTIYLDYARKMAEHLVTHQRPDGSWYWVFDAEEGSDPAVTTEKGTPLWSFLFYRLYHATQDERYLVTARKALMWCLEHQYTGPDPEAIGGLVGRTNASMVGYRYFYDATCAYATGFFGLAILEELKLSE